MLSKYKLNQLYFKDTQFANLMTRRIFNVLLIANPYDAFMLEDDGRIDEKIFNEYTSLSLRYPPRFSQVSTEEEALAQLESMSFDLVICMPSTGDNDSFDIGRHIKEKYEHIPIVILTPFSHGITKRIINEDLSAFEYVFCWLGNTDLLVSIIKLMEDKMNLEHDVQEVGVQLILVVEDGIRFYSSILPNLYKFVLKQSQEFSTEALNAHQRTLRMRGRPKIVLARTYQEAMNIYRKYQNNILGVITDVRFPKVERGEKDGLAGIKLCAEIRKNENDLMPYLRPDAKSQVTIEYDDNGKPLRIDTIVVSTQHDEFITAKGITQEEADLAMQKKIAEDVKSILIPRVKAQYPAHVQALFNDDIIYHVNPTGKFVIGGPHGDTGLTGRKIIVDTYGGKGAHGGGAFSGKDPSKVDRSAAYAARHIAKNLVAAGVADEMLVQVSYAIGVAKPMNIFVNTFGRANVKMTDGEIAEKIWNLFDMRPKAIEERLKLRNPIYLETASYGHMGRKPQVVTKTFTSRYNPEPTICEVELFTWEKLDYVDKVKEAFGL